MKHVLLDTNVYIDWLNRGEREALMVGAGLVRHLCAIVVLELRVGAGTRSARLAVDRLVAAYQKAGRLLVPPPAAFDRAGAVLRKLKLAGREIRSASLVNDVLLATTARLVGATVFTANARDFQVIREVEAFSLETV